MGVLEELIGVVASLALLSRCTNLAMCSAIKQSHVALQGVHLHLFSLCGCLQVWSSVDPGIDEMLAI